MRDALAEDQGIASVLRSLAPPDLYIGVRRLRTSDAASLHDVERRSIVRATPIRQREFGSGRALLRAMLERDVPVPRSASRSPVFPRGTVGSLAHDHEFAVAALGSTQHFVAIGIDVEPVQTLDEATDRLIRLPGEEAFDTIALPRRKGSHVQGLEPGSAQPRAPRRTGTSAVDHRRQHDSTRTVARTQAPDSVATSFRVQEPLAGTRGRDRRVRTEPCRPGPNRGGRGRLAESLGGVRRPG